MTISHTAEKICYPMAVTMKTAIFWHVTLQTDRRCFRQSCHFHHDGRSTMQMEAAVHSETSEFLLLMTGSNVMVLTSHLKSVLTRYCTHKRKCKVLAVKPDTGLLHSHHMIVSPSLQQNGTCQLV
jgi:hypothetical protein